MYKKFSSISILNNIKDALLKYPLLPILGTLAAAISTYLTFNNNDTAINHTLLTFAIVLWLSMWYCLSAYIFAASQSKSNIGPLTLAILFCVSIYWSLNPEFTHSTLVKIGLSQLLALLVIILAPNWDKDEGDNLIGYASSLIIAFVAGTLATILIAGGLSAAYLALDTLLEIKLSGNVYQLTWIWSIFVISPLVFASVIPELKYEQRIIAHPRFLNFHTYLLLALSLIYLLIIYAYEIKILFLWQLPSGTISWLICSFASVGIFTWLISYPVRGKISLANLYNRCFYYLLLPLIPLLIIAAFLRVDNYGITENRYFLIAVCAWLTIITTMYTLFRTKDIRLPFISLAILTLISMFGPLSSSAVSWRSQSERLISILTSIGISVDNESKANSTVSKEVNRQLTTIFEYLYENHGREMLSELFKNRPDVKSALTPQFDNSGDDKYTNTYNRSSSVILPKVMSTMNLKYIPLYEYKYNRDTSFSFYKNMSQLRSITNIPNRQYYATINQLSARNSVNLTMEGDKNKILQVYLGSDSIIFELKGIATPWADKIDLKPYIDILLNDNASAGSYLPDNLARITFDGEHIQGHIDISNISGLRNDLAPISVIGGLLFFTLK